LLDLVTRTDDVYETPKWECDLRRGGKLSTSQNPGKLIDALFAGQFESPPWGTFLNLLRTEASADFAATDIWPNDRPFEEAIQLLSGDGQIADGRALYKKHFYPEGPMRPEWTVEGRPYSLEELINFDGGVHAGFYEELIHFRGISAIRQVRVRTACGVNGWLTIARRGSDFTSHEAGLLTNMAPILRGVLSNFISAERQRLATSLMQGAIERLQVGWLALDRCGNIVETDTFGEHLLARSKRIGRNANGRITLESPDLEREVLQIVVEVAADPQSRPRAISITRDPLCDMLLLPAPPSKFPIARAPAVIAYVHGDNWRSMDRHDQLNDLFALAPNEARLALALCRGRTIAEASADLGLTIETTRSYSKAIYGKTGARGQSDLVRIIMGSVLALAPAA
jgi:DNA-binding CsgD family transcriptional regulator